MERPEYEDLRIRLPVTMIQCTEEDGRVWPIDFDYEDPRTEERIHVHVKHITTYLSMAEMKHGAVGDRFEYETEVRFDNPEGGTELRKITDHVWYSKTLPRQWFILLPATKEEYEAFYRLPGSDT